MSIFIVEDDPAIQNLYKILFNGLGFNVKEIASDGQKAVDLFRSFSQKPDIVVMDHRMPVKNGIDAAKEIIDIDENAKIIFATADAEIENVAKAIGVIECMIKPFPFEDLVKKIKSHVN